MTTLRGGGGRDERAGDQLRCARAAARLRRSGRGQCLILLHEKGGTTRWQPVSPTLMRGLILHHEQRGSAPTEQLLRYRNGRPITARRYDHLWERIGKHLPWVATQQVSTHWLRHTTLTWVERQHGYAVARAYAGHTGKNDAAATTTYITADLHEVATALAALTGEPHPLAEPRAPKNTARAEPAIRRTEWCLAERMID